VNSQLKFQWALWAALFIILMTGIIIDYLSYTKNTPLELRPNTHATISVFRPLPHTLNVSMEFNRSDWSDKRPELGEFGLHKKSGFYEFSNPGSPVKILIHINDKDVMYEALPAAGYNAHSKYRSLVPFVDDGHPNRFPWLYSNQANESLKHVLSSGYSNIEISVVEVGSELVGEKVNFIVEPPVSLKSHSPGYDLLFWFIFWPFYAVILIVYGSILIWLSVRAKKSN